MVPVCVGDLEYSVLHAEYKYSKTTRRRPPLIKTETESDKVRGATEESEWLDPLRWSRLQVGQGQLADSAPDCWFFSLLKLFLRVSSMYVC